MEIDGLKEPAVQTIWHPLCQHPQRSEIKGTDISDVLSQLSNIQLADAFAFGLEGSDDKHDCARIGAHGSYNVEETVVADDQQGIDVQKMHYLSWDERGVK